ncbi:MAG: acylphosphatase [Candidatus Dactylopiibacterium carminicum]|uniref:Acylphosphatase n=1 Tax=Candidatus Dactylopiibacterium carminicum TaxID=857335 RepID=A0A272EPG0_9RHOO|nr:acylphosphatase [Candidatus Dactylopiibacterium carminicum]PAS91560.1 MAG: acylphosphatase [Candidatus Dactylopiibacterium carminicum]PAS93221.1 MAG: acylphosphatase [Candidatus Dactylopiibacterium carminicum]
MCSRHLRIRGRVQGVGFRHFLTQHAQALGLGGWVRNLPDGSVEALICGPQASVAILLQRASEGPAWGRVDEVLVEDSQEQVPGFGRL